MSIGPLPNASLKSPPAVDQEALRIGAAMEHIKAHGNLDGFPAGRGERVALVTTAAKQGLLVWNRSRGRYELTIRGHRHARALRRAGRNALRGRQAGAVRSGMNAVVTAAGAIVVLGAVFLAFNPTGPANLAPAGPMGAYFAGRVSTPAVAPVAQGIEQGLIPEPRAVTAAAIVDSEQGSSERAPTITSGRRADASGSTASVQPGEAARSLAAAIGSEPEIVTGAARKAAGDHRDPQETAKLVPKQKKSGRRGRSRDDERETLGPGYAYAPYGGARTYGQWSSSPWWFR
jgi:hypothetical protein